MGGGWGGWGGHNVREKSTIKTCSTLVPLTLLVEAAAIIICQSDGGKVLMRANARCRRKLKGGETFRGIIPTVSACSFSRFHLIDSPPNVALHLDVIRMVFSQKMKPPPHSWVHSINTRRMTRPLNLSAQYLNPWSTLAKLVMRMASIWARVIAL